METCRRYLEKSFFFLLTVKCHKGSVVGPREGFVLCLLTMSFYTFMTQMQGATTILNKFSYQEEARSLLEPVDLQEPK